MRMELSQTVVLKELDIAQRPMVEGSRIVYVDNPERTPYIVFDRHREAPIGFGVKVGATKTTYILQRRTGAIVVKAKVGDVAEFANIKLACLVATDMARCRVYDSQFGRFIQEIRMFSCPAIRKATTGIPTFPITRWLTQIRQVI